MGAARFDAYFRLADSFEREGCPVCQCLREDILRHLEDSFGEGGIRPTKRETDRRLWNLCNRHARLARDILSGHPQIERIKNHLMKRGLVRLRSLTESLQRLSLVGRWIGRLRRNLGPKSRRSPADCPACRIYRENEEPYLLILMGSMEDAQFGRAFERSSGLCLPHATRLAKRWPRHPNLKATLRQTEKHWQRFEDPIMTLAEGGKSHPVPPPADPEAPPWDLAVELFFGAQEMPEEDLPIRPGKDGRETESSRATSPVPPTAPPESEGLLFGKRKLELRVTELTRQFGEASARASSLHYRLWQSLEAQKVLEMNLSGERANARMLEQMVEDLKNEIHRLKQQAGADFGSAQGPSEPGCHGGVVP